MAIIVKNLLALALARIFICVCPSQHHEKALETSLTENLNLIIHRS
jgi:hypothetical protein